MNQLNTQGSYMTVGIHWLYIESMDTNYHIESMDTNYHIIDILAKHGRKIQILLKPSDLFRCP